MRLLCGWLHWCAQKGRRGILAGNANILICSIATLNSVYLDDRLGKRSEVGRTKRRIRTWLGL